MNPTLIYLFKVNIALTLFYIFYRLFFAGDTLWKSRRFYLLISVIISFAYPLFSIEYWLQGKEIVQEFVMTYAQLPEYTVSAEQGFSITFLFVVIYLIIACVCIARTYAFATGFNNKHQKIWSYYDFAEYQSNDN